MSDDEGFLEFRIGEKESNPWETAASPEQPQSSAQFLVESPSLPRHTKIRDRSNFAASTDLSFDDIPTFTVDTLKSTSTLKLESLPESDAVIPVEPSKSKLEIAIENPQTGDELQEQLEDDLFEIKLDSKPALTSKPPSIEEKDEVKEDGGTDVTETEKFGGVKGILTHTNSHSVDLNSNNHAASSEEPSAVLSGEPRSSSEPPKTVHFEDDASAAPQSSAPQPSPSKRTHSRASSHIEYHQGPTGEIEMLRVDDESGKVIEKDDDNDDSWTQMATVGTHEVYDDKNNLVVEEMAEDYGEVGNAAASGYTRVANNDDAASITSLDAKTDFLFDAHKPEDDVDAEFQMAATKSMLTDQQRIAYAGLCRLVLAEIANKVRNYGPKSSTAVESLQRWGSKFILRLYIHLGLDHEEQLMIESLATHNLLAEDLTPYLKQVQKVTGDGEITKKIITEPANEDEIDGDKKESYDVDVTELHEEHLSTQEMDRSLEVDVKWTVMCDLFLISLEDEEYDARARTLLTLIGSKLGVTANEVSEFERKVTEVLQIDDSADQDWTEVDIVEARRRKALRKKYAYVGLATVGGGLVIGLSGGLLAPVVGAGLAGALGTIGIAGTGGFLAGVGGTAIIATASTAIGARVGSQAMLRRVGHVKTFEFRPIFNNNRANLVITVSGWMTGKEDDVRLPFSTIDPLVGDVLSVLWEPEMMRSLGQTINIFATEALTFGVQQILAATVFSMLMASIQAPMWLAKLSYLVDNPWSVSLDRAWAAGLILADTLMQRKLGKRPATLVGYSLGARVIYSCISELARRKAYGLVQDVYMFGTPVFYNKKKFAEARAVVSGRLVNGYSRKDWILAFLFPAAKRYGSVLGLDAVPDEESALLDIENIDVSDIVDGHMNYRAKVPKILSECGWPVLSEEFEEIEDPDPEHTREKQLKLLSELETAEKPKKTGFFSSWGFDWMQRAKSKGSSHPIVDADSKAMNGETLFDVDAIRNEMQSLQPRMVFEQEPVTLPQRDESNIPVELLELDPEPVAPMAALDYDDPDAPKPLKKEPAPRKGPTATDAIDEKNGPKLQFDDLE